MQIHFSRCTLVVAAMFVFAPPAFSDEPSQNTPEQKVVDKWVGNWLSTYKMSIAGVTTDKTMKAEVTAKRVLGGRYVEERSKHSDENRSMFMLTYEPEQKCYRGWWFSSNSQPGEYTGEWDEASQTMTMTAVRTEPTTLVLTYHFEDNNNTKWNFLMKDGAGKTLMQTEGTNVRVKDSKE